MSSSLLTVCPLSKCSKYGKKADLWKTDFLYEAVTKNVHGPALIGYITEICLQKNAK
jgi:hypothetical protein